MTRPGLFNMVPVRVNLLTPPIPPIVDGEILDTVGVTDSE